MILLRKCLIEIGIFQKEFAKEVGYARESINYVLNTVRKPLETGKEGINHYIRFSHAVIAKKIRAWMKENRRGTDRVWDTDSEAKKRDCDRTLRGKEISKGLNISYHAMIPGNPDHSENHKGAIMLTLRTMKHFGLKRNPFMNEITEAKDIFLSEDHIFIKEMMLESARYQGFTAVYGEVGCGKSVMRKAVYRELQTEGIQLIYPMILDKTRISAAALLDAIIMDLADERPKRSMEAKTRQAFRMLKNRHQNGLRQVLVIEEAHLLNVWALKHLKQIYEFEDGYRKLAGIVLIGQPELAALLDEARYPQLREVIRRITVAEIEGLSVRDLGRYITHKFDRVNGKTDSVFATDAVDAMGRRMRTEEGRRMISKAYPLSINNLACLAMNRAAELGETLVTAQLINSL